MKPRQFLIPFVLLVAAVVLRIWIAPLATRLPGDYSSRVKFAVQDRFRASLVDAWQENTFIAQRTDQTLSNSDRTAIIQGNLDWTTESGQLIFENTGVYGVDRRTRIILGGYGDVDRSGQFLFPQHVRQTTYTYWDPMFIGQRSATFDHIETLAGLPTYVFHFTGVEMDETSGYTYMADVPERYLTRTDAQGTLWIEPLSGIVLDYAEQGVSYFIDPTSGARLTDGDFHIWSDLYTPETKAAQLLLARLTRLRIQTFELWLPGGLALAGLFILAWVVYPKLVLKRTI